MTEMNSKPTAKPTYPMPLLRLVCPSGIVLYPLMPGDPGYGPESEQFVKDMMLPLKQKKLGEEQAPKKR